jgi:transcription initiation factor TFIIIB Brf1 subunit/transcription initiation factor TFIIB
MYWQNDKYRLSNYEADHGLISCPTCGGALQPVVELAAFECKNCKFTAGSKNIDNLPSEWREAFSRHRLREDLADVLKDTVDALSDEGEYQTAQKLASITLDLESGRKLDPRIHEALNLLSEVEDSAAQSNDSNIQRLGARVALARHQVQLMES